MINSPKLRTIEKYKPPYPLNEFHDKFAIELGKDIVYLLATRGECARLEGSDWEEIFARIIGADWKPSNVGLDDVVMEQCAWGAKTVKHKKPSTVSKVRLISGRNSPIYSFGDQEISNCNPNELGEKIISIWNERVAGIRKFYKHVRTVVLVKSSDLLELSVFEFNTVLYPSDQYLWKWNKRNNLEGFTKTTDQHTFTWQPHGSQFTIIEKVPSQKLSIKIQPPPLLNRKDVLDSIHFDESWIKKIT